MRGLAHERTSLSWSRTALSAVVVAALLARDPLGPDGGGALFVAAIVLAAIAALLARHRVRVLAASSQPVPTAVREITALGGVVGLLGLAVGLAVLLG